MGKRNKISDVSDLVTEVHKKWSPAKLKKRREQVVAMIQNHQDKIHKRQIAIMRLDKELANLDDLEKKSDSNEHSDSC